MSNQGNSDFKTCIFALMSVVNILFPVLFFLGIIILISRNKFFKNSPFSSTSLQFAFVIRALSSLAVFYIYSEYYTVRGEADTFKYFDDSHYMAQALWNHPLDYFQMLFGINCDTNYFHEEYFNQMSNWVRSYDNGLFNDNRLIIRFNAFIRIFSFGNYHVHALVFNLIAFIGSVYIGKVFYTVSGSKLKSYFTVFLVPSLIFWSSGIFKESILLFALGAFLYLFYQGSIGNWNRKKGLVLLFMAGILIVMKLYVFAAFLPACICYYVARNQQRTSAIYLGLFTSFLILAFALGAFKPELSFIALIVDKQRDFINLAHHFDVNSAFPMDYLQANLGSLLKASPEAILNAFTKPWIGEVNSVLFIPPLFENILLLFAVLLCFYSRKKLARLQFKFIFFCLVFTLVLYLIIGLTTPITGALVRYKIPAAPFIWITVLMLLDTRQFPNFLTRNKLYKWLHTSL